MMRVFIVLMLVSLFCYSQENTPNPPKGFVFEDDKRELKELTQIGTITNINNDKIVEKFNDGSSKIKLKETLDDKDNFSIELIFYYKNGDIKAMYKWTVFKPFNLNKSTRLFRYRNGQLAYFVEGSFNSKDKVKIVRKHFNISGQEVEESSYSISFNDLDIEKIASKYSEVYKKKNMKILP